MTADVFIVKQSIYQRKKKEMIKNIMLYINITYICYVTFYSAVEQ